MSRMIDADAMLSELRPVSFEAEHSVVLLSDVSKMMREWVDRQPTITPPTVGRCKDCDNWNEQFSAGRKSLNNYVCYCSEWSDPEIGYERYTLPNDYCSYFEPKEGMEKEGMEDGKDRSI